MMLSGSSSVWKPGPVMESRLTTCVMPFTSLSSSHRSLTSVAVRSSCTRIKWLVVMPKSSPSLLVPTMPVRSCGRESNRV